MSVERTCWPSQKTRLFPLSTFVLRPSATLISRPETSPGPSSKLFLFTLFCVHSLPNRTTFRYFGVSYYCRQMSPFCLIMWFSGDTCSRYKLSFALEKLPNCVLNEVFLISGLLRSVSLPLCLHLLHLCTLFCFSTAAIWPYLKPPSLLLSRSSSQNGREDRGRIFHRNPSSSMSSEFGGKEEEKWKGAEHTEEEDEMAVCGRTNPADFRVFVAKWSVWIHTHFLENSKNRKLRSYHFITYKFFQFSTKFFRFFRKVFSKFVQLQKLFSLIF